MIFLKYLIKTSYISSIYLCVIVLSIFLINCTKDPEPDDNTSGLVEYTGFLKTPGIGFQTFGRFEDEDPNTQNMPFESGSAYFRWMWEQVEPQEGEYNWEFIDQHLARAHENNQTLEFRIMLEWPAEYEVGIPQWLADKGVSLRPTNCEGHDYYSPDMEDPILKEHHEKLIRALGERYDGHPDLGSVDIGSVGMWGEWHTYCHPELMPSRAERSAIIDLYYESFPNTPLVALVDDKEAIQYAAEKGRSAWRGDCWGHLLPEGGGWNHHADSYWPAHNLIPEAWKNGPVALESCWTMERWLADGRDITQIVDDAIDWHASLAHNKSHYIPGDYKAEVERLVMKLGFRLVLREIELDSTSNPGSNLDISMEWENIGIAPPYRDHRIAFRLRGSNDNTVGEEITDQSIKGWLPGKISKNIQYSIPEEITSGVYQLETALVFHSASDRMVPIAIEGKMDDGWYLIGEIQVE